MVNSINLTNFKCFSDAKNIDLKPLTILCGTNSSGKSSVIQSILLLKQSFESQSRYNNVALNGQYVHLGSFQNVVYKKDLQNEILINFKVCIQNSFSELEGFPPLRYIFGEYNFGNSDKYSFDESNFLNICIGLKSSGEENYSPYINSFRVTAKSISSGQPVEGTVIDFKHIENQNYKIKWKKTRLRSYYNDIKVPQDISKYYCPKCKHFHKISSKNGKPHYKYAYFYEHETCSEVSFVNLIPEIEMTNDEKTVDFHHINRPLQGLRFFIRYIFSNIFYIGPLREEPSRRYISEANFFNIGNYGENAPLILSIEGFKKIQSNFFMDLNTGKWITFNDDTLKSGVDKWLGYMGISNNSNLERSEEIIRLNLMSKAGVNVTLADVGFGVSQILPILVEGLRIGPGQTLILEQPEIHLHPKLQMELADFFVSMALSGKKVLIETHSDHIINRIVRRIIEDEEHDLRSLTNILFFEQGEENSINPIEIDSDKGIINWPTGFFDQASEEIKLIMQKGIEKRIKKRKVSL